MWFHPLVSRGLLVCLAAGRQLSLGCVGTSLVIDQPAECCCALCQLGGSLPLICTWTGCSLLVKLGFCPSFRWMVPTGFYQSWFVRPAVWNHFLLCGLTLGFCLSCSKMWVSSHTNCWIGWKMHSSSLWMSGEFFKIPGARPVTEEKHYFRCDCLAHERALSKHCPCVRKNLFAGWW